MSLNVRRLSPALGAEITGIDVDRLDDKTFEAVHKAFLDHQVIVFRNQHLTPEQQIDFSRRFGELEVHIMADSLHKQHPEILVLSNRKGPDGKYVGSVAAGDTWHSDMSYMLRPSLGSLLYALEVPEEGGDTEWANMYAAYETLPEKTKERIEGLKAIHTFNRLRNPRAKVPEAHKNDPSRYANCPPDQIHPVVRTHPETGRKALFVSPRFTIGIVDMDDSEAQPLLDELFRHQVRREFVYHHKWELGDLLFWDNRCTIHLACGGIKPPGIRHMHRTTVIGDVPH